MTTSSTTRLRCAGADRDWARQALRPLTAADATRKETVQFAKGSSEATIKGVLKGDQTVDYRVRAGAGQTLTVALKGSNAQNYFNVLPPGSADVAMFVGQDGGGYKGVLPTDGDYTVRVYLMRPAAGATRAATTRSPSVLRASRSRRCPRQRMR